MIYLIPKKTRIPCFLTQSVDRNEVEKFGENEISQTEKLKYLPVNLSAGNEVNATRVSS